MHYRESIEAVPRYYFAKPRSNNQVRGLFLRKVKKKKLVIIKEDES